MNFDVKNGERITCLLLLELTIDILEHEAKPESALHYFTTCGFVYLTSLYMNLFKFSLSGCHYVQYCSCLTIIYFSKPEPGNKWGSSIKFVF